MFTDEQNNEALLVSNLDTVRSFAERCFTVLVEHSNPQKSEDDCVALIYHHLQPAHDLNVQRGGRPGYTDYEAWTIKKVAWLWAGGDGWTPTGWPGWYTHTTDGTPVTDEMRWSCWASHGDDSPHSDDGKDSELLIEYWLHRRHHSSTGDAGLDDDFLAELEGDIPDRGDSHAKWLMDGF